MLFKFTYESDRGQMALLRMLSKTAYQNVTYQCRNSAAYYDDATKSYGLAAEFLSADDHELKALDKRFTYSVPLDECRVIK